MQSRITQPALAYAGEGEEEEEEGEEEEATSDRALGQINNGKGWQSMTTCSVKINYVT